MKYQWGRKDPFVFSTSSEQWGALGHQYGKYPVKIYTIDGVLIYQENNGGDNKEKQPVGGVIHSSTPATSMMETLKNHIMFYGSSGVINQSGHTQCLWDYYWTSCSRGTDGSRVNAKFHNSYLEEYTTQRFKSIYDPCPYGFRVPSNGTYNQFNSNHGWTLWSYIGGVVYEKSWFTSTETRENTCYYVSSGRASWRNVSIPIDKKYVPTMIIFNDNIIFYSGGDSHERYRSHSVRCIEVVTQ